MSRPEIENGELGSALLWREPDAEMNLDHFALRCLEVGGFGGFAPKVPLSATEVK
jgi:hypothetical protein